jgi:DNA-binding phage protein
MFVNKVSPQDIVNLYGIATSLQTARLSPTFIASAIQLAHVSEGVYNLLILWSKTEDAKEKDEIIADIQDLIDDSEKTTSEPGLYIRFDDLEKIASHIDAFKNSLLLIVTKQIGSITKLAEMTGIPQPSLSRFFNSSSMPRKSTLLKIARALNLSEVEIASEWVA